MTVIRQYLKPFKCAQKRALVHLRILSTKCVYKSYIFNIYVKTGFSIKWPTMVDMP